MSSPSRKKDEDSSSSGSSGSTQEASSSRILSSKRVGEYIYQLVGYPKTSGVNPASESTCKLQTKESESPPRQQKARKSFPNPFKVPPHLLGRTPQNPEADEIYGRKLQKPRPGVKVPSLNLTSQILSKEELCQEVLQRTKKQTTKPELARKLSHKLAHKISENLSSVSPSKSSLSPASIQGSSTNNPNDETEVEVVIIEENEEEKSCTEQSLSSPLSAPVAGILSAVKRKSLLDLMKKEYVAGLNLGAKTSSSQGSDSTNPIPTPPSEPATGCDLEVIVKESKDGSSELLEEPTPESLVCENGMICEEPASPVSSSGTVATKMDSNILDVEAAVAALHGEQLEHDSIKLQPEGTDNTEGVEVLSQVGDPVIVDVRSIKSETVTKKKRRKGSRLASAKTKSNKPLAQTMKSTGKSRPNRRELDRLFIDEGAINMLCDMEKKGLAGRRSGTNIERTTLIPKDLLNQKTLQTIRSTRLQRRKWEPVTDVRRKRATIVSSKETDHSDQIPTQQDQALQHWQAVKTTSGNACEEVVYVPRQFANPADASRIVRRRSCSSDSSSDGRLERKKRKSRKGLKEESATPAATVACFTYHSALHDHGYISSRQHGEELDINTRANDFGSSNPSGYQEINVRYRENFIHVVLNPRSSMLPNSLNPNVLKELISFLRHLKEEPNTLVVLLTSVGSSFCTGFDFPRLINEDPVKRQEMADSMSQLISEFITELANCDQLLVGGLCGSVIGLGVALLPYLDVVYASDKATFYLPYAKLGQSTEGAITLALRDHFASRTLMSSLIYEGRHMTAMEVEQRGLIDSVLWPSCFHEDLIARVQKLATQATQSLLATKKLARAGLRRELPAWLEEERQLLVQSWTSEEFQKRSRRAFEARELLM